MKIQLTTDEVAKILVAATAEKLGAERGTFDVKWLIDRSNPEAPVFSGVSVELRVL